MNPTKLFIPLLFILLAILLLLLYRSHPAVETPTTTLPSSTLTTIIPVTSSTISPKVICFNLNSSADRERCFAGLGVLVDDKCESIVDAAGRAGCYIGRRKMGSNASMVCGVFDDWRADSCYADLAIAKLDPTLCKRVSDTLDGFTCIGEVAGEAQNASFCSLIPAGGFSEAPTVYPVENSLLRDFCFASVAVCTPVSTKDTTMCERIADADLRVYCRALVLNDTSLCGTLSNSFRVSKCSNDMSSVNSGRGVSNPFFPGRPFNSPYAMMYFMRLDNGKTRLW